MSEEEKIKEGTGPGEEEPGEEQTESGIQGPSGKIDPENAPKICMVCGKEFGEKEGNPSTCSHGHVVCDECSGADETKDGVCPLCNENPRLEFSCCSKCNSELDPDMEPLEFLQRSDLCTDCRAKELERLLGEKQWQMGYLTKEQSKRVIDRVKGLIIINDEGSAPELVIGETPICAVIFESLYNYRDLALFLYNPTVITPKVWQ